MKTSEKIKRLHRAAVAARNKSYSPYSQFKVGAAVTVESGEIYSGCNIENASYGATICAERTALLQALAVGEREFTDLVVTTEGPTPAVPCALCLQMMAEFFGPKTRIWVGDLKSIKLQRKFSELLSLPFGPQQLAKAKSK